MKNQIMIAGVIIVMLVSTGCSFISPNRSKALSEKEQVKLLTEQIVQLTRIADSLEKLTQK